MNNQRVYTRKTIRYAEDAPIFFTSDLHFGHAKIMIFNPDTRRYSSLGEMNDRIIANINETVGEDGILYILGDIAMTLSVDEIRAMIMAIRAKEIHLVVGNHDEFIIPANSALFQLFNSVSMYRRIRIGSDHVVLSHYPIESWEIARSGSYMLHGHLHSYNHWTANSSHRGGVSYRARRFDVGIDSRIDNKPYSWAEIKAMAVEREKHYGPQFEDHMEQLIHRLKGHPEMLAPILDAIKEQINAKSA